MRTPRRFPLLLLALLPIACTETIRIGVLVDDASPAKANFTAAATLAETQINAGLAAARSQFQVQVIVGSYGGTTGKTQATRAIDLINLDDVHGIVSDVSGAADGPTGTVAVNRLNYESPLRIDHQVPVTCYQCSSAFFNDSSQSDLGFKDPENWLWRTFFNASFESAVQVQLVVNRPSQGDSNGDGYLKISVYYDGGHLSAATTMAGLLDALPAGPHAVKLVQKLLPSTAASRAAELAAVLDSAPDGHPPDAVYLAFLPQNAPESLADYSAAPAPKPPATANNGVRRDFLLPTLLASGGEGLHGSSVRVVAASSSGQGFLSSFQAASGGARPELTASFLYDAIAVQALGVLQAAGPGQTLGHLTPQAIRDAIGLINQPDGKPVEASANGFEHAAQAIRHHKRINYDGAASPADLTPVGEMYPDLVHWQIQGGQFVEFEGYRCDPAHPNCTALP
jgi:hypothetical protein